MTDYALIILILGFGTARITALITKDAILDKPRNLLFHWFPPEDNHRENWAYQELRKSTKEEREHWSGKGVKVGWLESRWISEGAPIRSASWLGKLISCPFCVSVWVGFFNFLLWHHFGQSVLTVNAALTVMYLGAVATVKGGWYS